MGGRIAPLRYLRECGYSLRGDGSTTRLHRQWPGGFPNPEEQLKSVIAKILLDRRMATPAEIAALVVFLLSKKPDTSAASTCLSTEIMYIWTAL
jgi:NAD(P)-dependent dehydrogenase (short-subunit alcohol dehydrogenase family)